MFARISRRSAAAVALTLLVAVFAAEPPAVAIRPGCNPTPTRAPWADGVAPGAPDPTPFLSAHRGGTNLAPQQTAEAYRSALAFGATVIEVDLHVLADGTLAVFHDDASPSGTPMGQVTRAEFKSWNAATGSWKGTAFDPARYLTFPEALDIARQARAGLDIEFKDLDPRANSTVLLPYETVARAVADAGLMDQTIWQYHDGQQLLRAQIRSVDPDARFNYNLLDYETPAQLYAKASQQDFSFGSDLDKFTPARLAAIHDGCGIAVPHSYDAGASAEFGQITSGRSRGVDGFQTNQVDVAADALDRPAPSTWVRARPSSTRACLVNPTNGFGLIGRQVQRADGITLKTGPGGCVEAGPRKMAFAGDGAALAAVERDRA